MRYWCSTDFNTKFHIKLKAEIQRLYDLRDHIPDDHQHVYNIALDDLLKEPIEVLESWIKKNKQLITTLSEVTLLYDLKDYIHHDDHYLFDRPLHLLLQKSIPTIKRWIKRNKTLILDSYEEHQQHHPHHTSPSHPHNHFPQSHNHTIPTNLTNNSSIS